MNYGCLECGHFFERHVPWCPHCMCEGTVVLLGARSRSAFDAEPEIVSARDLARMHWQQAGTSAYPELQVGRGALVVVTGDPGSGKSSFVARALDGTSGPVVLLSAEEAPGPALASRLLRARVKRDDFMVIGRASVDQLVDLCRSHKAAALAVDSAQPANLNARDLRHLLTALPSIEALYAVAQVNAQGHIAGRRTLEHEADIVVRCAGLRWELSKSRYEPVGKTGDVMPKTEEKSHVAA